MPDPSDRLAPPRESSRALGWLAAVVVIAAIGAGAWYWWQNRQPPYLPPPPQAAATQPEASSAPKHPIAVETAAPLPALKDSDGAIAQAGVDVVGKDAIERFFNLDGLVRRIVATVDNLTRESVAARVNPVRPIGGAFVVRGKDAALAIAPENSARYTPFVRAIEHVDMKKAAAVYVHFYPLFQQAYEELGYPGKYFNDRLVEVIDNLLDAPEPNGPIALTLPHVLYEYRDPDLQARPAGQKTLIRMGRANEAVMKSKLRELREAVLAAPSGH